jgi:hypothetical protein
LKISRHYGTSDLAELKKIGELIVMNLAVALLVVFISQTGAFADENPQVLVKVRELVAADHVLYHYTIINNSEHSVVALNIGFDYYYGVPELPVPPLGWELARGLPASSATSPPGWLVRVITTEESPYFDVKWDCEREIGLNVPPGDTLAGFSVLLKQANSAYRTAHYDVILENATHVSAPLILED